MSMPPKETLAVLLLCLPAPYTSTVQEAQGLRTRYLPDIHKPATWTNTAPAVFRNRAN